jgi:PIN domain nuclease of toxin-antitoxin system
MKLLLDTHAFLWLNTDPTRVGQAALPVCRDRANTLYLSLVSLWEIQIKHQLGKLELRVPWAQMLEAQEQANGVQTLPLSIKYIRALQHLPPHHRDPFDRMLIAQAQAEGMALVTADPAMSAYDVTIVW